MFASNEQDLQQGRRSQGGGGGGTGAQAPLFAKSINKIACTFSMLDILPLETK